MVGQLIASAGMASNLERTKGGGGVGGESTERAGVLQLTCQDHLLAIGAFALCQAQALAALLMLHRPALRPWDPHEVLKILWQTPTDVPSTFQTAAPRAAP